MADSPESTNNSNSACPCASGEAFGRCCEPIHNGEPATTAEALMRSRYTAFVRKNATYLLQSWHPATRPKTIDFDPQQRWVGLKIKHREAGMETDATGLVCFAARYKMGGKGHRLEECSRFVRLDAAHQDVSAREVDSAASRWEYSAASRWEYSAASRWVYLDGDIH